MTWQGLETAIETIVRNAARLGNDRVVWEHRNTAATWRDYPRVVLSWVSSDPKGQGFDHYQFNDDTQQMERFIIHLNTLRFQVRMETNSGAENLNSFFGPMQEFIACVQAMPETNEVLEPFGVALNTVGEPIPFNAQIDNAQLVVAVVEVTLSVVGRFNRTRTGGEDYFTSVQTINEIVGE